MGNHYIMNYEDALKIADEKLGILSVQYENMRIPSLRWKLLKELRWFAPLVRLAKIGLEAERSKQK